MGFKNSGFGLRVQSLEFSDFMEHESGLTLMFWFGFGCRVQGM